MTLIGLFALGFWEILIIVAALAILLGVPIIVVAAWTYVRRIIRRVQGWRRR